MVSEATKDKFRDCTEFYKTDTGARVKCEVRIPRGTGDCPERRRHIRKLKTGFCEIGACEGEKKLGATTGVPLKPCTDWEHCPCECHTKIDQLYSMMDMHRVYKDMSGYEPPINPFKMPTLEERAQWAAAQRAGTQDIQAVIIESPLPDVIPTTLKRDFAPTPTGRAAKGQLESWVRSICDEYLVEKYQELCTPAFVAELVGKAQGINPPSSGAVDAVFKRWDAIGFAMIARKPTRFIGYTPEGVKLGLDAMKLKAKDASKVRSSPMVRLRSR